VTDEIFLIHHSHTDIGFTHDQPTLWDAQRRFLDDVVDRADPDAGGPGVVRWTVETTAPLVRWLRSAEPEQVARFERLEAAGRIEVTGMLANITPLFDHGEVIESLRPVQWLRDRGFDVRHAMNCDVNGQNWPLADALLDAGIEGFSMGINEHFGGAPDRPAVFRWEAPSGRTLPTLNGFHYSTGWRLGIGRDADDLATRWGWLADHLDRVDWPYEVVPVQSFHPFGDNAPAYDFGPFIREWNDRPDVRDGGLPRLRTATLADFWDAVDPSAAPVRRGDWTDFWNFGAGSSARETGMNRESRRRLRTADGLEAHLSALGRGAPDREATRRGEEGTRAAAWWDLAFYDEHTWGASTSVGDPAGGDARSQWHQKAGYAYDARAGSGLLRRDALAELARHVGGDR
jgi:hypothetical protein